MNQHILDDVIDLEDGVEIDTNALAAALDDDAIDLDDSDEVAIDLDALEFDDDLELIDLDA